MTAAADLLARCRALGIDLAASPDGSLTWEADADPPGELLADLAAHKVEVLALLAAPAAVLPTARPSPPSPPSPLSAADREWIARAIEADLGLPDGSQTVAPWPQSCPGCSFCRPAARESGAEGRPGGEAPGRSRGE